MFFCKYNDPSYVKVEKLEVMIKLATAANMDQVLMEFREYASEVDVDFVRKARPPLLSSFVSPVLSRHLHPRSTVRILRCRLGRELPFVAWRHGSVVLADDTQGA